MEQILFFSVLLYINDFASISEKLSTILYADDTNI